MALIWIKCLKNIYSSKNGLAEYAYFWLVLVHVRLVCNIYCAHARLCFCDSTIFCFRKLKSRRLIFLINCGSNLTINIVSRGKEMRKEWLAMPHLPRKTLFLIPNLHLSSSLLMKELKLTHMTETKGIAKEIF